MIQARRRHAPRSPLDAARPRRASAFAARPLSESLAPRSQPTSAPRRLTAPCPLRIRLSSVAFWGARASCVPQVLQTGLGSAASRRGHRGPFAPNHDPSRLCRGRHHGGRFRTPQVCPQAPLSPTPENLCKSLISPLDHHTYTVKRGFRPKTPALMFLSPLEIHTSTVTHGSAR